MNLSLKSLEEAVSIRRQIESLERRIASIFGGSPSASRPSRNPRASRSGGRRAMSAQTRAKLSAAAKARWARRKGNASASKTTTTAPKKGGLTPAGRKRLSQLMKARWAARKRNSR